MPADCTFVSVGKLEKRKGMEVALDGLVALAKQFPDKTIRLLGHWMNPFIPFQQTLAEFADSRGFKPVVQDTSAPRYDLSSFRSEAVPNLRLDVIMTPLPGHRDIVEVYRAGDWGLFPHTSEGWGLPLIESMACGLPPITQFYSGPTEYLEEGAFIPLEGFDTVAQDKKFFHGDVGTWRRVHEDSLVRSCALALHSTLEEREAMGKKASEAACKFDWSVSAERTMDMLRDEEILK
jgi:glycosyltransferase involved in cell wall biosynthesis